MDHKRATDRAGSAVAGDRPNVLPWPPILYLAGIVVAMLLGAVAPFSIGSLFGRDAAAIAGWLGGVLMLVGLMFDVMAIVWLFRNRTPVLPTKGAAVLVTDGPFAFSRNPIYLGNTLLIFGVGLFFENAWYCVVALVCAFAVQRLAIEREERHLAARFGETWDAYAGRVRRWL